MWCLRNPPITLTSLKYSPGVEFIELKSYRRSFWFLEELVFRLFSEEMCQPQRGQARPQNDARSQDWKTLQWGTLGRSRP